jgi:hypothetical protein
MGQIWVGFQVQIHLDFQVVEEITFHR